MLLGKTLKSLTRRWAFRLPAANALAWLMWAILTPVELPGSPTFDVLAYPEEVGCFDCPYYVLLGRSVDQQLLPLHPVNGLELLNRLPLVLSTTHARGRWGIPQVTGTVAPVRFALLATAQWLLLGIVIDGLSRLQSRGSMRSNGRIPPANRLSDEARAH